MRRNDPLLRAYAAAVADMERRDAGAAAAVREYVAVLRSEAARRRLRERGLEARVRELEVEGG